MTVAQMISPFLIFIQLSLPSFKLCFQQCINMIPGICNHTIVKIFAILIEKVIKLIKVKCLFLIGIIINRF